MKSKMEQKSHPPKFHSESTEAEWWASPSGRNFLKQMPTGPAAKGKFKGSALVASLNKKSSVQIALRLPTADVAQARKIAERKGIGYQTLLKILVREGLLRESRHV
jgi:predicted DNA binding CopG/RHH family protein